MESIWKAREEIKGDEISNEESEQKRKSRVRPKYTVLKADFERLVGPSLGSAAVEEARRENWRKKGQEKAKNN